MVFSKGLGAWASTSKEHPLRKATSLGVNPKGMPFRSLGVNPKGMPSRKGLTPKESILGKVYVNPKECLGLGVNPKGMPSRKGLGAWASMPFGKAYNLGSTSKARFLGAWRQPPFSERPRSLGVTNPKGMPSRKGLGA